MLGGFMKIRPKRRRSKDNPYILNFNEKNNTYTVSFKAVYGNIQIVSVDEKIYNCLDKFVLQS